MDSKIVFVFFLILVSLIFFGLIISIIFLKSNFFKSFKKQEQGHIKEKKELEIQFLEAQIFTLEEERKRISIGFHDEISPLLAALKNQIRILKLKDLDTKVRDIQIEQVNSLITQIIENHQNVIRNLASRIELANQLSAAMQEYLKSISSFEVNFEEEISEVLSVDIDILNNVYSLFMELIHNIVKHEKISSLSVHLRIDSNNLDLNLSHDGIGLNNDQYLKSIKLKEGKGLSSIQSRLDYIGAKMELFSMSDGTVIHINSPIKHAKRN
jgi:signal transduction histidine kinase